MPQLRGNFNQTVPSIGQIYTEATAPGLTRPSSFLQPGGGIQVQPSLFAGRLRLHYLAHVQDFVSLSSTPYSFVRWTTDIGHEFPLARKVYLTAANPHNGPDSCAGDSSTGCPHISSTINNEGSVSLRILLTGSAARAGNAVPFYFDPTTGGSNVNGEPILASYPDYRFRAPNLVLLRGTVEHALPKIPFGAYFSVDAAKSPLTRSDIDFSNLRRSYSVGLTVHAGGLPVVYLLFAWGGNEGTHTTFSVSNILLWRFHTSFPLLIAPGMCGRLIYLGHPASRSSACPSSSSVRRLLRRRSCAFQNSSSRSRCARCKSIFFSRANFNPSRRSEAYSASRP